MRTCSIDIGIKNFAIYVEDHEPISVPYKGIRLIERGIQSCTKPIEYDESTDQYKKYLIDNIYSTCTPIYANVLNVKNFTVDNCSDRIAVINMLDYLSHVFESCDEIIVENQPQQIAVSKSLMFDIVTILETYIYVSFKKQVRYVNASNKTKHFTSAISKLANSKQYAIRKKFVSELVIQMMIPHMNDPYNCLSFITSLKKKDDILDAICQLQVDKAIRCYK